MTVFGCRWWPLRTPTLNPKFKDISHINFVLYKYCSYDYRLIFVYTLFWATLYIYINLSRILDIIFLFHVCIEN